jgi:hypothetical protein
MILIVLMTGIGVTELCFEAGTFLAARNLTVGFGDTYRTRDALSRALPSGLAVAERGQGIIRQVEPGQRKAEA